MLSIVVNVQQRLIPNDFDALVRRAYALALNEAGDAESVQLAKEHCTCDDLHSATHDCSTTMPRSIGIDFEVPSRQLVLHAKSTQQPGRANSTMAPYRLDDSLVMTCVIHIDRHRHHAAACSANNHI